MRHLGSFLLSILFSLLWVLGYSFSHNGDASLFQNETLYALCLFLLFFLLAYGCIRALVYGCERKHTGFANAFRSWQIGLVLLIAWLPYYAFTFPGVVSSDSVTQMKQLIQVAPLTNANPVFQTFLVGIFMVIGKVLGHMDYGVMLYVLLQAVLMSWLLGAMLAYLQRRGCPKWLWGSAFVFFALNPIFPLYAFCVGKDTNFAMAVTWFVLLTCLLTDPTHPPSKHSWIALCLSTMLCTLLRNVGLLLVLTTLLMLTVWLITQSKHSLLCAPLMAMTASLLVYGLLHAAILPVFHIPDTPETENYSVPLQQVLRVWIEHDLPAEDTAVLSAVMDTSLIPSSYNGQLSDPIKDLWKADVTTEERNAFFQTWAHLLKTHPLTCLSATFHNTFAYVYPSYVYDEKPTLLIGRQGRIDHLSKAYQFSVSPRSDTLKSFANTLLSFFPTRLLLAPGLYGCLSLFSFCYVLKKRRTAALICMMPALLTLIGCFFSAVNGYFRYAMPLYFLTPFLLWLCTNKGAKSQ